MYNNSYMACVNQKGRTAYISYKKILKVLKDHNITYFDFCETTNTSQSLLNRIGNDKNVTAKSIAKIVQDLDRFYGIKIKSLDEISEIVYK